MRDALNKKSFFFHYNKPASLKAKRPVISLHYDKKCYLLSNVIVNVPTMGKINKRQPFFVMRGYCSELMISGSVGVIS